MHPFRHDSADPAPLHARIQEWMRKLIKDPQFQRGEYLPDEVTLAQQLGVSRGTVRAGLAPLVAEGLIERAAGKGTRVRRDGLVRSRLAAWRSLTREMEAKDITVELFDLRVATVPATPVVAQALQLAPRTPVLRVDRLRGWSSKPALHSRSWLHPRLGLGADEDFSGPLYEKLERQCGVEVAHAEDEIEAVAAPAGIASALGVPARSPVLLRRHTIFDARGGPIEYAQVYYRSDRFVLTMGIRKDA